MFSIARTAITKNTLVKSAMAGTAAAAFMLAGAAPTLAQEAPAAQAQTEMAPVTDAEIETFIAATMEVQTIVQKWEPKLQEAQGTENAATVQQEMQAELMSAVEEEGMEPERYNQIYVAAGQNPELAQRIQAAAQGMG